MGKKQKSTHIRCRRCGRHSITSRSGLAPRVAMANLQDAANSAGVSGPIDGPAQEVKTSLRKWLSPY